MVDVLNTSPELLLALFLAAVAAGWVDAVVGGGGLIIVPTLLLAFPGVPPATAIGTTKVVSASGTASAVMVYLRRTKVPRRFLLYAVPIAAACSGFGAFSATVIATEWMRPLVLVLLLVVGFWVALRPAFGTAQSHPATRTVPIAGLCAAAAIAFYDGLLGPGTGTFLIVAFTALVTGDFLRSAAMAKVINLSTNLGALVVFAATGHVVWLLGLPLAVGNIIGSQLGSRMAIARGARFVRIVLLVVVCAMVANLARDIWLH